MATDPVRAARQQIAAPVSMHADRTYQLRADALTALAHCASGGGQVTPWQAQLIQDHIGDLTALARLLAGAPAARESKREVA